jgi:hypothetical protein
MPRRVQPSSGARKLRQFYRVEPWRCRHYKNRSEISAYVEASGQAEIVAVVLPSSGASAEALAEFIAELVNDNQKNIDMLPDALAAIELVLEEGRLTFTSEQAADVVAARIRKRMRVSETQN